MNLNILPIYKRRLNPGLLRLLKKLVLRPPPGGTTSDKVVLGSRGGRLATRHPRSEIAGPGV